MDFFTKRFSKIIISFCFIALAISLIACEPQTIQLKPEEVEVTYMVEHYLQNVSGDGYEIDAAATQILKGKTGAFTQAQAKTYEGFTPIRVEQKLLRANDFITIRIEYSRDIIEYTFDAAGGKFFDEYPSIAISGRFGASLTAPDNPEKDNFDFTGWNESLPQTFGAEDKTFTATWTQKTSQGGGSEAGNESGNESGEGQEEEKTVEYTVVYYTQNKYNDDYSRYDSDKMTGKVGEKTQALAPELEGYTVKQPLEEKTIAEDGSTVVEIKYDRKIIKYTFNAGEGHFANGSNTLILSGRYGASVPTAERPSRSGYDFESWDKTIPYEYDEEELTFNASWKFGGDAAYKIIYWEQNISDNNYTKANEYPMTASAGEEVTDEPFTKEGFTAKPVSPVTVAADGSTVLNVYYDRNIITYTFDAKGGNWNGSTANVVVKGRYGAAVTVPANPARVGYDFWDWDYDIPQTFGDKDITFTAYWTGKSGIQYTVKYWKQNVDDDEYTIDSEDPYNFGKAGQKTNVYASASYFGDGFTQKPFEQQEIAGDGSTVVNILYDRKIIDYTFNTNGGTWENGSEEDLVISGKFGAAVPVPQNPSYDYPDEYREFGGWKLGSYGNAADYLSTFDRENKTFNAIWKKVERNYTVKHLKQKVDSDEYEVAESETKSGYAKEDTNATAKTYVGFTAPQTVEQPKIAVDGSTVVEIKYNRINIEYTFQVYGGSINGVAGNKTVTKRYGLPVEAPADPEKTNYTFRNWYSDSSFKNLYDFTSTPSQNTTIYAGWNYVPIQVSGKITIDGTEFDKTEEVYVIDPAKTGDDITVVEGKPYISSNTNGPFKEGRSNSLSPFIMGKYEVTQELYTTVMTNQKVTVDGVEYTLDASPFICLETGNYQLAEGEDQALRPAENMTWYDAVYFCNKLTEMVDGNDSNLVYTINIHTIKDGHITYATVTLDLKKSGYRLPTQTEWEFAFRGGNPYIEAWDYLFSGSPSLEDSIYAVENTGLDPVGWYNKNSDNKTHEVGLKSPNALGIFDMSGNVGEWCYDWQDALSTGSYSNYTGGASSSVKIVRGGSFNNNAGVCTNYHIDTIFPEANDRSRGFRLARSVTQ